MNRINDKGMHLIQYKTELIKEEYPEIVKKSLLLALEKMVENEVLDMDSFMVVKDESVDVESLEEYLLTKTQFSKTNEEIFQEFEILRKNLDEKLIENGVEGFQTMSDVEKDVIIVVTNFSIDEEFTLKYFRVQEKDLLKLMKPKGFIEKFAILRLPAIFKPFIESLDYPEDLFHCDISLAYFNKNENNYAIDLYFEIPVEEVEKEEKISDYCVEIKKIIEKAVNHYESKIVP